MKDIIAALDILYAADFDQNVTVIFADMNGFKRFKAVEMQLSRSQNRVIAIIKDRGRFLVFLPFD